jgi:hypothetical protein
VATAENTMFADKGEVTSLLLTLKNSSKLFTAQKLAVSAVSIEKNPIFAVVA